MIEEEKVTYKWVVEDLCPACAGNCQESIDNAPPMPPAPEPVSPKKAQPPAPSSAKTHASDADTQVAAKSSAKHLVK
jgi:hypothetical protein